MNYFLLCSILPSAASDLVGLLWELILLRVSRESEKLPEKVLLRSTGLSSVFILWGSGSSKRRDWEGEPPPSPLSATISLPRGLGRSNGSDEGRWLGGDRPCLPNSIFPLDAVSKWSSRSLGLNLYWCPGSRPGLGEGRPDLLLEKLSTLDEVGFELVDSGRVNPEKFWYNEGIEVGKGRG